MSNTTLHPQLEKDSLFIAEYQSLQIRLVKDNRSEQKGHARREGFFRRRERPVALT